MPREPASSEPGRTPARGTGRFKRRELRLADGSSLVLNVSGSIDHVSVDGATIQSWAPDDADWPRQALRFGVHPEVVTVAPHGRDRSDLRPGRR